MGFSLLFALISLAVSFLLAPKIKDTSKPAGVEDVTFPTSTDKPIPVIFGRTRMPSPNVIWAGRFRSQKVTKKKNGQKVTLGFLYYYSLYLSMAFGDNSVRIHNVWADKKKLNIRKLDTSENDEIAPGDVFLMGEPTNLRKPVGEDVPQVVENIPIAFGGSFDLVVGQNPEQKIKSKRPAGYVQVHDFNDVPGNLKQYQPDMPVYPGLLNLWMEDLFVGISPRVPALEFEVSRYPTIINADPSLNQIGADANPAFVLYEIYTNTEHGLNIDANLLNLDSFLKAAEVLKAEGVGISGVVDGVITGDGIIKDILETIGGVIRQNVSTGQYELKLTRSDYVFEDLLEVDESMVKSVNNFTRANGFSMPNEISVKFRDRDNDYNAGTVTTQNLGLIQAGKLNTKIIDRRFIKDINTARFIAGREIRSNGLPLARANIVCNRKLYKLNVGDVFRLNYNPLGIDSVMRVIELDTGVMDSGQIVLTAVEDVYGLDYVGFEQADQFVEQDPNQPQNVDKFLLLEAPKMLGAGSVLFAGRNDFDTGFVGGNKLTTENDFQFGDLTDFAVVGLLGSSIGRYDSQFVVNVFEGVADIEEINPSDISQRGFNLLYIEDGENSEWINFQTISNDTQLESSSGALNGVYELLNVQRGLLDTPPKEHGEGARVWFIDTERYITARKYRAGNTVQAIFVTNDNERFINEELIDQKQIEFTGQAFSPIYAGGILFDGEGDGVTRNAGTYNLTWISRTDADFFQYYDEQGAPKPAGEVYRVEVINGTGDVVETFEGVSDTSQEITINESGDYFIQVTATENGKSSRPHDVRVKIN